MIKSELLMDGALVRHYSDSGRTLLQVETGVEYSEAADVVPCRYTYQETARMVGEMNAEPMEERT